MNKVKIGKQDQNRQRIYPQQQTRPSFWDIVERMIGKNVSITIVEGDEVKGVLLAVDRSHFNVIIRSNFGNEKIVVRGSQIRLMKGV